MFDPCAGGGTIPLEAQRLGLKAIAADLNPVAVMINKAMIEIPAKFAGQPPVNPEAKSLLDATYEGAQGLAKDIAYYGKLLKQKAFEKIGHLYPKVKIPETGQEATVIAWIWARTVKCPNPACGCEMPLVKSFWLSKKKGKEVWLAPVADGGKVRFAVRHGAGDVPEGTVNRTGAKCVCCGASVPFSYIREEGKAGRMGAQMMAIVAESTSGRLYLVANEQHETVANIARPTDYPDGELAHYPGYLNTNAYGLDHVADLFSNRQLTSLVTFSDCINDVQEQIVLDGGLKEYREALAVYLSFIVDKLADWNSTICGWNTNRDGIRNTFARPALPMVWDYVESNPFSNSSGCVDNMIEWTCKCVNIMPITNGIVHQNDATQNIELSGSLISTDPPYYSNIPYADVSDFFYIWLRKSLHKIYPDIFSTLQTPKTVELVADPYRKGSKEKAKKFFDAGMYAVCQRLYEYADANYPVTIYYAFKQTDSDLDGDASSGWETMLNSIVKSGFSILGTWPVRTERPGRTREISSNALASSIVLVCRKRESTAATCTRKNFLRELKSELETSLENLQKSNIAPVDMAQSAIGPGISVFSRYQAVLESDGSPMTVRSALKLINQALDDYFRGQSENIDAESRFAVDLYTQCGFNEIAFGEADVLARARNVAMNKMTDMGIVKAAKGKVRLSDRDELPTPNTGNSLWLWTQVLVRELGVNGIDGCAKLLMDYLSGGEAIKNFAYRLYQIADKKGWAQEGTGYNNLVISWTDIETRREELKNSGVEAVTFDF